VIPWRWRVAGGVRALGLMVLAVVVGWDVCVLEPRRRKKQRMVLTAAVISLLDSILKLGLLYVQALPAAQQQQAALQVFEDFNVWRKTFGLPVFTPTIAPVGALPKDHP
jgi:hypothetical protein